MSVIEKEGWLRIEGGFKEIVDYSRKLLSEKEYFGAFARVHTLVEVWMEILLHRQIALEKPKGPTEWMQMLEAHRKNPLLFTYAKLLHRLKETGSVSPEEEMELQKFHQARTAVEHWLLKGAFQTYEHYNVSVEGTNEAFEKGVRLARLLFDKCKGEVPMTKRVPVKGAPGTYVDITLVFR